MDIGIGPVNDLGKGLGALTIEAFMVFCPQNIDGQVTHFFIDPSVHNPRAIHVYKKVGFKIMGQFVPVQGGFVGQPHMDHGCEKIKLAL